MNTTEIMQQALKLTFNERYQSLELLHENLDKPDAEST